MMMMIVVYLCSCSGALPLPFLLDVSLVLLAACRVDDALLFALGRVLLVERFNSSE